MRTLKELHLAIRERCDTVGLVPEVISGGLVTASVALISTAPGPAELRTKMPFSGGSGNLLWDTVRAHGWNRASVYTTNVVKRLVAVRDDDPKAVLAPEFDLWVELLRWELAQLPNLQHILLLGGEALRALTPFTGIMNWRGSVVEAQIDGRTVPAMATVNPAMVLRSINILSGNEQGTAPMRSAKRIFQFDVQKFHKLTQGRIGKYIITHRINPTYQEAMEYIAECAGSNTPVATDIETTGTETVCVGLAHSPYEGMCIPFIDAEHKPIYSIKEEAALWVALHHLYKLHQRIVAQNGLFDAVWLWYKNRIKLHVWYDTLLAHHTLYPLLPHSLAFLTSRYTTHPYYKGEKDGWRRANDIDRFWRYNVKDCCISLAVQQATHSELGKTQMEQFFFKHVMRLQPHLIRMCVGGVKADLGYKEHLREQLEASLVDHLHRFHDCVAQATGDVEYKPNPASPRQLGELFFKRLRLVGRGASTDERNRRHLLAHPKTTPEAKAVVEAVNTYAKAAKFYGTYASSQVDPDGRFRTEYKQFGTSKAPGRLSSAQSPWGSGMNLQNQPVQAQPMFVCEPGYGMAYCDGAQAEARVVGWLCPIPKWIEQFERARMQPGSYDAHRALASEMWRVPYDEVPIKDWIDGKMTIRYRAKRCRHGLNYRMGAQELAEQLQCSLKQAVADHAAYHRTNPELRVWWAREEEAVRRGGVLYNLFGRRWVLTEVLADSTLESIVAFKPQSTIGDLINRAIYMSEDDPEWPSDARVALNNHDALVAIAPVAKLEHCARIIKRHIEFPMHVTGVDIPLIIPGDIKVTQAGTSWRVGEGGQVEFYNDNDGYHRWSDLKSVA